MSDQTNKPRIAVLAEKLRNFFTMLLDNNSVKRSPKAVMSIETTAKIVLAVDPKTGTCPGYEHMTTYIDEWIKPAFEWVEITSNRWEWRLRDGSRLLKEGDATSPIVTWHQWLMINNLEYYDLKESFFSEAEMKKVFEYLRCFLVLSSPFARPNKTGLEVKREMDMSSQKKIKVEKT